jgi:hypothetical protein
MHVSCNHIIQQIMRSVISNILLFLLFPCLVWAQAGDTTVSSDSPGNWHAGIELQAVATSGNAVPFWMRTNHFGSNPISGVSGSLLAYAGRDYTGGRRKTRRALQTGALAFQAG